MGWKSSMEITREDAINEIMKRLLSASNEELVDVMDGLFGEKGYNFRIIGYYEGESYYYYKRGQLD